jgi:FtsP/CotA-like multicopper oxidase with cupredoxin domain
MINVSWRQRGKSVNPNQTGRQVVEWYADRVVSASIRSFLCFAAAFLLSLNNLPGQSSSGALCGRPGTGGLVPEPADLESHAGVLNVQLSYRNDLDAHGHVRYCYVDGQGREAPVLRVKPGDWVALKLQNELTAIALAQPPSGATAPVHSHAMTGACGGGSMNALATNLHFHGLTIPPVCHQDDVLQTFIAPGNAPFEYRFQIPPDEPPGLYWYHPHVHGFTSPQVLGGASGAIVVEGIERANTQLAGLPERVFIIRDQDLLNPDAAPVNTGNVPPPLVLHDAEGDILNTGTGGGKPAKDLSLNFVPTAYPEYAPSVIAVKPSERQLWRVLNASAITYLDLQVLLNGAPQRLGVVSLDGIPVDQNDPGANRLIWESHVLLPPAGRVEFIFKGLPPGAKATFLTRSVDTGPDGENDPTRPLAMIVAAPDAPEPLRRLETAPAPLPPSRPEWLGDVKPACERKLYFSEKAQGNPPGSTVFFITVDGQAPAPFDPGASTPNITVRQGDVEDWIVENRSREVHAFHIHQTHFVLVEWNGVPVDEPFLRDTINVAYWDGRSPQYPSVRLRMDFRDPSIEGTFLYHCHLLEHEDGGMMGTIRVLPRVTAPSGGF